MAKLCKNCLSEAFDENVELFPTLMPIVPKSSSNYQNIKMHNGTIWRWVRPVIGENENGSLHLRVEQRIYSSSPSSTDDVANIAFYLGLSYKIALMLKEGLIALTLQSFQESFYKLPVKKGFRR